MQSQIEHFVGRPSPIADETPTSRPLHPLAPPSGGRGAPLDLPNMSNAGPNPGQPGQHIQLQLPSVLQGSVQQQQHMLSQPQQQLFGLGLTPGSQQPMQQPIGLLPVPPSPQQQQQQAGLMYNQQHQIPQVPAPQMQPQHQLQQQQQQAPRLVPGTSSSAAAPSAGAATPTAQPPYVKFFMQRVTTNVAHVLFYVVDKRGFAKLAVVGTDVKLSGHFVYASVSDMSEAPPLRCTNRTKVLEWLSALGAASPADDHEVMLPELAPHHWQQLHSADPMWTKPQLDRQYTGYREEVGTLPDGRHFKNYYLVDDNGTEKLMVMAEDGARLDRRYTYKAAEDVGGFCFENGKAVTDWLDYILGKSDQPPSFMRREGPPERKRKKKPVDREAAGRAGGSSSQLQQPSPGRANSGGRPPQGLAPGLMGMSDPASMWPPMTTPLHRASTAAIADDQEILLQRQRLLMQQQRLAAPPHAGVGGLTGGGGNAWPPGRPQGMPMSPPGSASPWLSPEDPYNLAGVGNGPGQADGLQQRMLQVPFEEQQAPLRAGPAAMAVHEVEGMVTDEQLSPRSMREAVTAAGAEVRAVFSADPDLLDWVTSMPDEATVNRVRACADRLTLYLQSGGDEQGPQAAQSMHEAVMLLQMLCQTPVSLRLLELTGICRPVALLSYHSQHQLKDVATRLTQRWRRVATAAHDCASAALRSPVGLKGTGVSTKLNML